MGGVIGDWTCNLQPDKWYLKVVHIQGPVTILYALLMREPREKGWIGLRE